MRVAILNTHVPFIYGGAEMHAESLKNALIERGHEADIISIPFKWYPPEKIMDHLLSCRLLDLTESCGSKIDKVIGLKFPAYHVKHPDKRLWILHQFRGAFDVWGTEHCDLGHHSNGREIRDGIEAVERNLITREAKYVFANSQNVAGRLETHCGIKADPLYHPPQGAEDIQSGRYDSYFYYPSRIATLKRQELVVQALAHTKKPVKVVFSGQVESDDYFKGLEKLASKLKVSKRISWAGVLTREKMVDTLANAMAVLYTPKDEDYGYVTLEGMLAEKPVITCSDSGGPLEFISHEKNGLISEPTPEALARQMDLLWDQTALARDMGQKGRKLYFEKEITWDNVVTKLLQ